MRPRYQYSDVTPALAPGVPFPLHVPDLPRGLAHQDDELPGPAGAAAAAELSSPDEVPEMCRMATPPSAIVSTMTRATMILSRVDMIDLPD